MNPKEQAELARMAGRPVSRASTPEAPQKAGWKRHGRLGRAFEARLESQHGFYAHQRLALVERQHVPIKWIGGKPTVVGRAVVDFMGVLAGDGRAVAFEAKNPSSGVLNILDPDVCEPHQVDFLRRWPGLGFWVICFGEGARAGSVLVPALVLIDAIDRARRGQGPVGLREAHAFELGGVGLDGVDWLAALCGAASNERKGLK